MFCSVPEVSQAAEQEQVLLLGVFSYPESHTASWVLPRLSMGRNPELFPAPQWSLAVGMRDSGQCSDCFKGQRSSSGDGIISEDLVWRDNDKEQVSFKIILSEVPPHTYKVSWGRDTPKIGCDSVHAILAVKQTQNRNWIVRL